MAKIPKNIKADQNFIAFLKKELSHKLNFRLKSLGVPEDYTLTISTDTLPDHPFQKRKDKEIIINDYISEQFNKDYSKTSLRESLEKLDPYNPVELTKTYNIYTLVNQIINDFHMFTVQLGGVSYQNYIGYSEESLFDSLPFKIVSIIKLIDYGSENLQPLLLFAPIFKTFHHDLIVYYKIFKGGNYANN